jgi:hypothetical protein
MSVAEIIGGILINIGIIIAIPITFIVFGAIIGFFKEEDDYLFLGGFVGICLSILTIVISLFYWGFRLIG